MTHPPTNDDPQNNQSDATAQFPVYATSAVPPPTPAEPPRKKAPWLIGAGILTILCCCGTAVGSLVDDPDSPKPAATSTPSTNQLADTTTPTPIAGGNPTQTPALRPTPPTTAAPNPAPSRSTAKPRPTRTTSKPKPPPAPKTDPRFDTCKEANANGYGPYVEGEDPEYDWYQDRDGDGIVCERR
ncbi:excalibur calcium-binding domain-containing protein [Micromonospora endolithica]|uniref:Excalibur calcium-binding domain-containing protein n=1 Tax=Micromonospora endolithica TaxID=230091 RepID=A0A3A9YN22_9ACTN|nr:excalibur calcium-binding domain-containing protein [Micromonospora endolithica]RKN37678.1 hypothetical protein D7223_32225 [Micromonospora endolithica]TWJ25171.1 excalibur calcium-binding domain-containing protein [Micromonospora endolithica]